MINNNCSVCKKDIKLPSNSGDELQSTGLQCQCLDKPICFECNMEQSSIHIEKSEGCCAFGYPKKGDYFYPK